MTADSERWVDGVRVPAFLYGTAWKEDETERLSALAISQGFRGIDTANQRKHYFEAAVASAVKEGRVRREELFLQTKFTFRRGQDHRHPYDAEAAVGEQVAQSFASSLEHLWTDYVDSLVLHGPSTGRGLADADWQAWRAMEAIHDSGRARLLGVSNVNLGQLKDLHAGARIKPRFVQNRCYAVRAWDRDIRAFAAANGIIYQGFSLLTANRQVLAHPELGRIAKAHGVGPAAVIFRFALDVGMVALTGTTSPTHMRDDLAVLDLLLDAGDCRRIETLLLA